MKRLLIVLLLLITSPALAQGPEPYKGTWYIVNGQAVRQADLEFLGLPDEVLELSVGVATNIEFYTDGNYWIARNPRWDFYFAGANDGSGFYCRYSDHTRGE